MISLRQHIFSLVAVFVALAVGIAAGSTVVRGPLLDSTRARLESAEQLIEEERAENDALAAEVAQLDGWAVDGPAQLVAGRLPGATVLLVVAGDVDNDVTEGVVRSLQASDGLLLGEVRIDSLVFDETQADRVGEALGPALAGEPDPAVVFGVAVGQLVAQVATELASDEEQQADDVVHAAFGAFEDVGLLDLIDLSSATVSAAEVDLVVLTDRNLVSDPARVLTGVIAVSDPDGPAITTLVAEVGRVLQDNESPMPSFVGAIRDSGRLRDEVSTVDNAETFLGWINVVLGLEAAGAGTVEHYGFRDGADRSVPVLDP